MAAGYTTSAAKGGLFTQNGNSTSLSHVNYIRDAYLSSEALAADITAISAQVAADLVQTDLDTIATAADRVQTGLDVDATAAALVQTNQDTIDTAADLAQTNQDTIATAADRVQTGIDAAAAALSASSVSIDQGVSTTDSPTFVNVSVTGTVDGRDVSVDGAKLDLIDQGVSTTDSPTFATVAATSYTGDGSALTGLPVGAVTAGLAVGAIGTYALCRQVVASTVQAPGATLAGSGLYYTSAEGNGSTTAPSGTWRIMGAIASGTQSKTNTSVWMRIS